MRKLIYLFLLTLTTAASAQVTQPDSVSQGGTSFTPQWNYIGSNASTMKIQFRNPTNGKFGGLYTAYQTGQLFKLKSDSVTSTGYVTIGSLFGRTDGRYYTKSQLNDSLQNERNARILADAGLNTLITNEATNRTNADNALQGQINAVVAAEVSPFTTTYIAGNTDWTSTSTYVNTNLAGKTYKVTYIGNNTNGGSSYANSGKIFRSTGTSPEIVYDSGGGFTLQSGYAAQSGDVFEISGTSVQPSGDPSLLITYLVTSRTANYWASSATSTTNLTTSSTIYHTNLIPAVAGDVIVFEGYSLAIQTTIGKLFNGNTAIGTISRTALTPGLNGTFTYTIPAGATTQIGLNLRFSDVTFNVYKQNSSGKKIQPVFLPDNALQSNGAGYAKSTEIFKTDLITTRYSGYYQSGATSSSDTTTSASLNHTNLIAVTAGQTILINGYNTSPGSTAGKYFDGRGIATGTLTFSSLTSVSTGVYTFTVPSGHAFVALNAQSTDIAGLKISYYNALLVKQDVLDNMVTVTHPAGNLAIPTKSGGYVTSAGVIDVGLTPNNNWRRTPIIPILNTAEPFIFSFDSGTFTFANDKICYFYDGGMNPISFIRLNVSQATPISIPIPTGAKYYVMNVNGNVDIPGTQNPTLYGGGYGPTGQLSANVDLVSLYGAKVPKIDSTLTFRDMYVSYNPASPAFEVFERFKGTSNYVRYVVKRFVSTGIRQNLWRTEKANLYTFNGAVMTYTGKEIMSDGENEFVYQAYTNSSRTTKKSDFTGGYHGDEELISFNFYIDGVKLTDSVTAFSLRPCNNFRYEQKSNMIQTDNATKVFEALHNKVTYFDNSSGRPGFRTNNNITWNYTVYTYVTYFGINCVGRPVVDGATGTGYFNTKNLNYVSAVADNNSSKLTNSLGYGDPTGRGEPGEETVYYTGPTNKLAAEINSRITRAVQYPAPQSPSGTPPIPTPATIYGAQYNQDAMMYVWDRTDDCKYYRGLMDKTTSQYEFWEGYCDSRFDLLP